MGDMDGLHAHTLRPVSPYGSAGVALLFPSSAVSLLTRLLQARSVRPVAENGQHARL